jgi:hypothetical protein
MELTLKPTLEVKIGPAQYGPGSVRVRCLGPDVLAFLGNEAQPSNMLKSVFRVAVAQAPSSGQENFPDVSGRYEFLEDGIQFIPHFPFERGLKYRACFEPSPFGVFPPVESTSLEFVIPLERTESALTDVRNIFPSSDLLPENLLRFYVCFSNPMQRGQAAKEISLLDSEGRPVEDALYRAPVELWDQTMRRLTVLLDPGRLKRWVGPNVELGLPLKSAETYTLEIGAGMIDAHGRELGAPFRKDFTVNDALRDPISPDSWKIEPPSSGTLQPMALSFPNPIDWALLFHTIRIQSADGLAVDGQIAIDQCETRWMFTPASPWKAGPYSVQVESSLEDVCGNNLTAAFDTPLRSAPNLTRHQTEATLTFQVR